MRGNGTHRTMRRGAERKETEALIRFNEIKAWDGKLPVYMAGDGTTTVPVLNLGTEGQ